MINARRHLDFPLLYTATKRACQSFPYDTAKSIGIRLRKNINNIICVLYLCIRGVLRNEFNFWKVHGIMNTSGLVQSSSR